MCQETADEINEACKDTDGEAIVIPCNISDKTALQMLVDETRNQFGQIDILVCNAATNPFFGSMMDIPDDALMIIFYFLLFLFLMRNQKNPH